MTRYILMTVCTAALALGMAPMAQAQQNCPPGARDCGGPASQYRPQKGDQPRGNTRMERQNPGVSQRSERRRPEQPPQAHQPSRNPDGRNPDGRAPGHRAPQPGGPQMGGPQTPPPDLRVGGRGDRGAPFRRAGSSRFPPPPPGQEYRVMPNGWLVLVNSDTLGIVSIVGLLSALVAR